MSRDSFSPSPLLSHTRHAAASYGQLDILRYLISRGGDVNITDDDGDTPLYTVENIETAKFLIDHGAVVDRRNNDGISPIEHLQEDFPDVANYLHSLTTSGASSNVEPSLAQPSQHQQEVVSERLTSQLLDSVQGIMQRAEAEGEDLDEELRQAISRTVLDGVATGYGMTAGESTVDNESSPHKRQRHDEGDG
ncbi:hypothetical protein AX15_005328 [Amanita polypyramis BW_CC]|nr:hypothetical protein AX15_005328 [Amanita polypyramis BW_CC]